MQDIKLPTNQLEAFEFWMNDMTSQFVNMSYAGGKKIEVTEYLPPRQHYPEMQTMYDGRVLCVCADCKGDER